MAINLVLVGSGKFGQKYIATLDHLKETQDIKYVVANRNNWKELINQKPDGVMICTPPQSHIEIAQYALEKNIPTMVEKPLALSLKECQKLSQYSAPILINHIHLFSSVYQNIKNKKTHITSIKSIGSSSSPPRDYSRLWDYAPHDISMILDLTQKYPTNIECYSSDNQSFIIKLKFNHLETISKIGYSDDRVRYLIVNDDKLLEYDGMATSELPLKSAITTFILAIQGQTDYRLGLDLSLQVIKVLEACEQSLLTRYID
jgi:hypothetical protein